MDPLRVASASHPAYAPQYVAGALGLFANRGLAVELLAQPAGSTAIVATLARGETDLVLGSMLFVLRARDEGLDPVIVAQSNQQVRHALVMRTGDAGAEFSWRGLGGKSVLVYPNPVPTPWIAFRAVMKTEGLSLDDVALIIGYGAAEAVSEFRRGVGDYLLVDPEGIDMTGLSEVARLADALGPVPWSVYCTTRDLANARREEIGAYRAALAEAIEWLDGHDGAAAAALIGKYFPNLAPARLAADMERYVAARLWVPGACLAPDQLWRWQQALRDGGLLGADQSLTGLMA
jgi:NitT/TauT family transport system substrate-binding protein